MTGTFVTSDHTQLAYEVTGTGTHTIILCDGVGCDHYAWTYIRPFLENYFRVVQWNYRGHGVSERPKNASSVRIENHAQDLSDLLEHLGEENCLLVGHSMGIQVILEFYGRFPSKVLALIPVCGSYEYPLDTFMGSSQFKEFVFPILFKIMTEENSGFSIIWKQTFPSNLAWRIACLLELNSKLIRRADFQPYLEHMAQLDIDLFARTVQAASEHSAEPVLETITVPTLIFAAEKDGFTPVEVSHAMARRIPASELCVIPGASHSAPIEVPDLFLLRLEKFFLENDFISNS